MFLQKFLPHLRFVPLHVCLCALSINPTLHAQLKAVGVVPHVTKNAENLGPLASSQEMHVTVWLHMQNEAAFDRAVQEIYTPGSSSYHHWMTTEELEKYAPTAANRKLVSNELSSHGLSIDEDDNPFAVKARGIVSQIEGTFQTRIHSFRRNGRSFHANVATAKLSGPAADLVVSISGLNSYGVRPFHDRRRNLLGSEDTQAVSLAAIQANSGGLSSFFTSHCFTLPETVNLGIKAAPPYGSYSGRLYEPGPICGFLPSQVQSIYGLPSVYAANLHGEGQTVVIVDAYGSSTLNSDVDLFSSLTGLPTIESTGLSTYYPDGQPTDPETGIQLGWNVETSLDVEWVHAIAPQAAIALVIAPTQNDADLEDAISYATLHQLGNVISNSYGIPEMDRDPDTLNAYNMVIKMAAAAGIAVNYSTGDLADNGVGSPVGAIDSPADSPFATAVGGTSFSIPDGSFNGGEAGWGNNETLLANDQSTVSDPPFNAGNVGGSGGGQSTFFAKPAWQSSLPGTGRLAPDVSALADPFTGAIMVYTDPVNGTVAESLGGTSLSCPIFSAFWALANQKAGHSLGQAAPILSIISGSGALHDILPRTSTVNVTGSVTDFSGFAPYTAANLAAPIQTTQSFVSAIWPTEGEYINLTFGTDTSLQVAPGWDDVTGWGTPVGLTFVTQAAKH